MSLRRSAMDLIRVAHFGFDSSMIFALSTPIGVSE